MKNKWVIASILIIALIAMCVGMVFIAWLGLGKLTQNRFNVHMFETNLVSATADEEQTIEVETPITLVVDNSYGVITIQQGEESEVMIASHKVAWGNTQVDAEAALETIQVEVTEEDNVITVKFLQPEDVFVVTLNGQPNRVDLTITVPGDTDVRADTDAGKIMLAGISGDAELSSGYGNISASRLGGALKATTESGDIDAQEIDASASALSFYSGYGNITLKNITAATLTVESNSGKIKVNTVSVSGAAQMSSGYGDMSFEGGDTGTLDMKTDSGNVTLMDVSANGSITLDSGYGEMTFESGRADDLQVSTSSGTIDVSGLNIRNGLTLNSHYGDLEVRQVTAQDYNLESGSGSIVVDGVSGTLKAETKYGDLNVTNASQVSADLFTSSGSIRFEGSLAQAPQRFESDYGDILIAIPEDSQFDLSATTDYGKIFSDIPVTLSGELDEENWAGALNDGGPQLTLITGSGDITIEILAP